MELFDSHGGLIIPTDADLAALQADKRERGLAFRQSLFDIDSAETILQEALTVERAADQALADAIEARNVARPPQTFQQIRRAVIDRERANIGLPPLQ